MIRNSVTFRDFHPAFIPRPPTIRGVHTSMHIRSDLVLRPNQSLEKRPDIFRDAEVAGSNPAVPTTKVLVRGLQTDLRPAPRSSHRTYRTSRSWEKELWVESSSTVLELRIKSATFSPIMIVVRLVLARGIVGMIDALSTQRRSPRRELRWRSCSLLAARSSLRASPAA